MLPISPFLFNNTPAVASTVSTSIANHIPVDCSGKPVVIKKEEDKKPGKDKDKDKAKKTPKGKKGKSKNNAPAEDSDQENDPEEQVDPTPADPPATTAPDDNDDGYETIHEEPYIEPSTPSPAKTGPAGLKHVMDRKRKWHMCCSCTLFHSVPVVLEL